MEKIRARAGLTKFAEYIDPAAKQWYRAKHLRLIASVLERVERGELKRVIISVPPRHWKSSLVSTKFPMWYLARHPKHSVIAGSYKAELAETFSENIRNNIVSNPRLTSLFPDLRIKRGSNKVSDWLLETGYNSSYRAVGVSSGVTGHGADLLLFDDPISGYEEAQSESQRDKIWERYKSDFRTRLEPGGAIVLITTRWHEDDPAGRLIQAENEAGGERWTVINIPAQDANGRYLWTDRYPVAEYEAIKATVGEYVWNALYQGNPTQQAGNLIKRAWFEYVPKFPDSVDWFVRPLDVAFTEKQTQKHDPDYTATCKACLHNDWLYLGEPRMWRKGIEDTISEIMGLKWNEPNVRFGMGRIAIKASIVGALENVGLSIEEYEENTDKIARATAWINLASQGRVKLVGTEKEWEPFMAQWTAFPNGAHDDAVDMVSGASQMLGLYFDLTGVVKKTRRTMQLDSALRGMYGGRGK